MRILGVNALSHDAALTVIDDGNIVFAAHAERFSQTKNDAFLNSHVVNEALAFGRPDVVAYYEKPFQKKARQLAAGQWRTGLSLDELPKRHLSHLGIEARDMVYVSHHLSHAAAGYYTSSFTEAAVVCIDAIGEWQTVTIWDVVDNQFRLVADVEYPHSIGLLYSAFTHRCGFKPAEDEHIMMGMAAYGEPMYAQRIWDDFIDINDQLFRLKIDCHRGIQHYLPDARPVDLAASVQEVTERIIEHILQYAKTKTGRANLVYSGGVALNCVANRLIPRYFPNTWIMPNPGDAGSSLGCAAYVYGKHVNWKHPFLGHEIPGDYPVEPLLGELLKGNVVGVANGRAEFGPRALGNRSLFVDPRQPDTKDRINAIKRRQPFRPFAPAILEEKAGEYFEMPMRECPYMQFAVRCRYPTEFPGIVHVDGTSRVQTVSAKDHRGLHALLQEFFNKTGCPMLLNTSLNIRGQPLVNSKEDGRRFTREHGVSVY